MTNEKLKEIEERLIEKGNGHRDAAIKEIDAHTRGYILGVNDALTAVSFVRPEQQAQPASEARTNLDRIRAMSAEEMANRIISLDLACEFCPVDTPCFAQKQGGSECRQHIAEWLNSPVKEDAE